MDRVEYLSTGEAAKILNISRSTVSRRYDDGVFKGKTNPITGERLISLQSVLDFIHRHNLPIDPTAIARKRVLVCVADQAIRAAADTLTAGDPRFAVTAVSLGSEALVACAKEPPDLLVLDDALPDIEPRHIIASLRGRSELRSVRILCCVSDVNIPKAASWGAERCIDLTAARDPREMNVAVCRLLGLGRGQQAHVERSEHHRKWTRHPVALPARIGLYPVTSPLDCVWGSAVVDNISEGGAFLSQMRFERRSIPGEPFRLLMEIEKPPFNGLEVHCQVVRLASNGALTAGVRFEDLSERGVEAIQSLGMA